MIRRFILASLLLVVGCVRQAGSLNQRGYQSGRYALAVQATPGTNGLLMGGDWQLDNFYSTDQSGGRTASWKTKDGDDYRTTYALDYDGDGSFEAKARIETYELRFTNRAHDGEIFLRTIPISTDQGQKRLNVIVDRYVEGIAGAGYSVVTLGEMTQVKERRYAATVESKGEAQLAGLPAYATTIEIKNLDQLKLDPEASGTRVEILFAHTKFRFRQTGAEEEFPVLLIVGYANRRSEFAESLPEFRDFLSRILVDGESGVTLSYEGR